MYRPYDKPLRGSYLVTVPLVFTRKDVTAKSWASTKRMMLDNIIHCYEDILAQVEKDIKNKK